MKKSLLLLGLSVFLGCSNHSEPSQSIEASNEEVQDNYAIKNREFDLQGHRGARGLFPENSLEGFISAVDLMVNTIEMDVVISKDKQVVVSHEPWISSTICWGRNDKPVAEGKGLNIYQMN